MIDTRGNINNEGLPPVIRLFISSTFRDMDRERSYFSEVIAPRLTEAAKSRGVSFFSVDLRWGITEEEQLNGDVLPICLGEIDRCRPFFIGIIGDRYGSTLDCISLQLLESYPWLKGKEGKSITELEMLYGVLDREDENKNCSFYFRSDELSSEWFGEADAEDKRRTDELKRLIAEKDGVPYFTYMSLSQFGEQVVKDFVSWLDASFPVGTDTVSAKIKWQRGELSRNYIPEERMYDFLDKYLTGKENLLITGNGKRGKTAFIADYATRRGGILVLCGADSSLAEPDGVIAEIERQRALRTGESISAIFVTDTNLLGNKESKLIALLPRIADGLTVVVSSNTPTIEAEAQALGYGVKEMELFSVSSRKKYLKEYLKNYGKSLSKKEEENVLSTPLAAYPGLIKFISSFLCIHGRFETLPSLTQAIGQTENSEQLYSFALSTMAQNYDEKELAVVEASLAILALCPIPLAEDECLSLADSFVGADVLTWAKARIVLEQFGCTDGDVLCMRDGDLQTFIFNQVDSQFKDELLRLVFNHLKKRACEVQKEDKPRFIRGAIRAARTLEDIDLLVGYLFSKDVLIGLDTITYEESSAFLDALARSGVNMPNGLIDRIDDIRSEGGVASAHMAELCVKTGFVPRRTIKSNSNARIEGVDDDLYKKIEALKDGITQYPLLEFVRAELEKDGYGDEARCYLLSVGTEAAIKSFAYGEALSMVNAYYSLALAASLPYHIMRCAALRADVLLRLDSSVKSAANAARDALRLAHTYGYLPAYVEATLLLSNCGWDRMSFEEYRETAQKCFSLSVFAGNYEVALESYRTLVAFLNHKDDERALEYAMKAHQLSKERGFADLTRVALDVEVDYAEALMRRGDATKGEEMLESCIKKAFESELLGIVRRCLMLKAAHSKKHKRFTLAAESLDELLRLNLERNDFYKFEEYLDEEIQILELGGYADLAKTTREGWLAELEKKRARKSEGSAPLAYSVSPDVKRERDIKKKALMAKSEGNIEEYAATLVELGDFYTKQNLGDAVAKYKEASDTLLSIGKKEEAASVIRKGIDAIVECGVPRDRELFDNLRHRLSDEDNATLDMWLAVGAAKGEAEVSSALMELLCSREEPDEMSILAINNLAKGPLATARTDILTALVKSALNDERLQDMLIGLRAVLVDGENAEINMLRQNPNGPEADAIIKKHEKTIAVLELYDKDGAAVSAGNIALIFRRREDRRKTRMYHKKSADLYRELGLDRDVLIEMKNLATAYRDEGDKDGCIRLLREALKEAREKGIEDTAAAIAGNLAHELTVDENLRNAHKDEIMALYKDEEEYFSRVGEYRDLVISLTNQCVFYSFTDRALAIKKLNRAYEIAESVRLSDLLPTIETLRRYFRGGYKN